MTNPSARIEPPLIFSPSIQAQFASRGHSRSPSRSPTRPRFFDDLLGNLSPATTLEALNNSNASGALKASVEAASHTQRAFGIRAAVASKNIHEWVTELTAWPWPAGGGSEGFEDVVGRRKEVPSTASDESDQIFYWGSLPVMDVLQYESRIDEIAQDMEDLDVEELKSRILETHTISRSRPSSSQGHAPAPAPPAFESYTRMDDFTAVVTATVLQALPNLSKLNKLMDAWSVRLAILRDIHPLMISMGEVEEALKSGWTTLQNIQVPRFGEAVSDSSAEPPLTRDTFEIMRRSLQSKVTRLGQRIDYMLDSLEGRQETIPDSWLDRMDAIEEDYGNWVVFGDGKIREVEWATSMIERQKLQALQAGPVQQLPLRDAEPPIASLPTSDKDLSEQKAVHNTGNETTEQEDEADVIGKHSVEGNSDLQGFTEHGLRLDKSDVKLPQQQATDMSSVASVTDDGDRVEHEADKDVATALQSPAVDHTQKASEVTTTIGHKEIPMDQSLSQISRYAPFDGPQEDTDGKDNVSRGDFHYIQDSEAEGKIHEAEFEIPESTRLLPTIDSDGESGKTASGYSVISDTNSQLDGASKSSMAKELISAEPVDVVAYLSDRPVSPQREMLSDPLATNSVPLITSATSPAADLVENARPLPSTPTTAQSTMNEYHQPLSEQATAITPPISQTQPLDTPETPSSSNSSTTRALKSPSNQLRSGEYEHDGGTPRSPSKIPRFGSGFGNILRQSSPSFVSPIKSQPDPFLLSTEKKREPTREETLFSVKVPEPSSSQHGAALQPASSMANLENKQLREPNLVPTISEASRHQSTAATILPQSENIIPESPILGTLSMATSSEPPAVERLSTYSDSVSGYGSSEPSPEIHEAEPAEYFRPLLSPVKSNGDLLADHDQPLPDDDAQISSESPRTPTGRWGVDRIDHVAVSPVANKFYEDTYMASQVATEHSKRTDDSDRESQEFRNTLQRDSEASYTNLTVDGIDPIVDTDVRKVSETSTNSTVVGIVPNSEAATPQSILSYEEGRSIDDLEADEDSASLGDFEDLSPSIGRVRLQGSEYDYSPPGSPTLPARRNLQPVTPLQFDADSLSPSAPQTPSLDPVLEEAPIFSNITLTDAPITTSPSKSTDSQLQQQISEILSNLPARISLTNSSGVSPLQVKKRNYSHSTSYRSFASRATTPTPSFTLAPAPTAAKAPRHRPTPSNPEIKLYHLSRSTGEAPIKLFVRLVGEHGERVMVRVGGGWADLGEYLKEYASHHGRRSSDVRGGRVEIQDLPPRNVSGASMGGSYSGGRASRAGGRTSPISRPGSSMDASRTLGGLGTRKPRHSTGEDTGYGTPPANFSRPTISPSTYGSSPPSMQSRSSSSMSWRDDSLGNRATPDAELGLAGPKGRKSDISKEKMEWVESMKEKVRVASAEKDRKAQIEEFGKLGKVGGTKRLFKKSTG